MRTSLIIVFTLHHCNLSNPHSYFGKAILFILSFLQLSFNDTSVSFNVSYEGLSVLCFLVHRKNTVRLFFSTKQSPTLKIFLFRLEIFTSSITFPAIPFRFSSLLGTHTATGIFSSSNCMFCYLYSILSSFVSSLFSTIAKRCSIKSSPLILSSLFCSLSTNSILDKASALLFNMPFL